MKELPPENLQERLLELWKQYQETQSKEILEEYHRLLAIIQKTNISPDW